MRQAWLICVLAVFGCTKKSEGPKAGAGSAPAAVASGAPPTTTDAPDPAVVAVDAGAAAVAVDAAAITPDDKLAAIPEAGILLATVSKEKLVVAKLDRSGVKRLFDLPVSELAQFAWLDDKTLAVREPYGKDDKPMVMKLVDGKPTEQVTLEEVWQQSAMLVTKAGEVWVERCTEQPEGPDPCTKLAYQRIYPSKTKVGKKPPKDVDAERVSGNTWARGFQGRAADVAAPAGVKLEKVKLAPNLVATRCTKGATKATYPGTDGDLAEYGYVSKSTRWVLAEPAVYELVADQTNPVGQVDKDVQYFIACIEKPLDGFIGLGGPLWGEYKDADLAGTWTFRVGTTTVGTLDGAALRANR